MSNVSILRSIKPLELSTQVTPRRYDPAGYEDYHSYKPFLRDEFVFRCAYCLVRERWYPNGQAAFGVDHFLPQNTHPELRYEYTNLVYACNRCNTFKGEETALVLNPLLVSLAEHWTYDENGVARALTTRGEAHILLLDINGPEAAEHRRAVLFSIRAAQRRGDSTADAILRGYLGFPADLPDLRLKRPPGGTNDSALDSCYYELQRRGTLAEGY